MSVEILSKNEKGGWAETYAAQWLIERGFWVFRNIAHLGQFDLVGVRKDGETFLFDVKYIGSPGRHRKNPATFRVLNDQQKALGVRLLCISSAKEVIIEPPLGENDINGTGT